MRRFLLIIAIILGSLGAPSVNSNAADIKPVEVVEWNLEFFSASLEVNGLHSDLKARIPWYSEVYSAWPLSVRYPKKVYLENTNEDEICYSLPLQIRKEIADTYILNEKNPIEIVFTPKIIFEKNNVTFRDSTLKIGPGDWISGNSILNKNVVFCLTRGQMDANPVIAILLQFSLSYSRLFSEFNTPKNLCNDVTPDSCKYIGGYGAGIDVTQMKYLVIDEVKNYEIKIAELKTFLGLPPCPVSLNCELAKRNLAFLESDLVNSKVRKLTAELKAKQDAEFAAAELKAKQEAEAKAAELRAKQEVEAKAKVAKLAAANKKITITCVKGKLTKKVTSIKPVCPSGYKKK